MSVPCTVSVTAMFTTAGSTWCTSGAKLGSVTRASGAAAGACRRPAAGEGESEGEGEGHALRGARTGTGTAFANCRNRTQGPAVPRLLRAPPGAGAASVIANSESLYSDTGAGDTGAGDAEQTGA